MNRRFSTLLAVLGLATSGLVVAGQAIDDSQFGLVKKAVTEVPTPPVPEYLQVQPGQSVPQPRYYPDAPPNIPHQVDSFLPITASNNTCIGCHNQPAMMGKKVAGVATPMPASHYTDLRGKPEEVTDRVIGARHFCTQCHVPQTTSEPLVENTLR